MMNWSVELTFVLIGDENAPQCLRQLAAPNPRVVDGLLEEERDEARGHHVLPDPVERKVLLDAVGHNEAVRDGGECSGTVGGEGGEGERLREREL